jgi:hypothetical protein
MSIACEITNIQVYQKAFTHMVIVLSTNGPNIEVSLKYYLDEVTILFGGREC